MKTCIHCKEQMQPDARVCPHCQRTQSRFDTRDPRIGLALAVLVIAGFFFVQNYFKHALDFIDGSSTAVAKGSVVVSDPSFSFVPSVPCSAPNSCDTQKIVVIGKLRNTSSRGVKDPKLIVSFYNGSHHLVDVVTESNWQTSIPAGDEVSFRATSSPKATPAEYVTFEIKVVGGRDLD